MPVRRGSLTEKVKTLRAMTPAEFMQFQRRNKTALVFVGDSRLAANEALERTPRTVANADVYRTCRGKTTLKKMFRPDLEKTKYTWRMSKETMANLRATYKKVLTRKI